MKNTIITLASVATLAVSANAQTWTKTSGTTGSTSATWDGFNGSGDKVGTLTINTSDASGFAAISSSSNPTVISRSDVATTLTYSYVGNAITSVNMRNNVTEVGTLFNLSSAATVAVNPSNSFEDALTGGNVYAVGDSVGDFTRVGSHTTSSGGFNVNWTGYSSGDTFTADGGGAAGGRFDTTLILKVSPVPEPSSTALLRDYTLGKIVHI